MLWIVLVCALYSRYRERLGPPQNTASRGLTITIPIATDMNATSPIIRLFTLDLALPRAATQMLSSALGMTYIASSPRLRSASTKSDRPEQNPATQ